MRSVRFGLCLLVFLCACEEAKVPSAPPVGGDPDSGPPIDSGGPIVRDSGAADSGTVESQGPRVTFVSPKPARNPNTDELITEAAVKVVCKVERAVRTDAAAVDKTSVRIGLQQIGDDEKETWIEPAVSAIADDSYEAMFNVSARANGALKFRCVARDLAPTPNSTTAQLNTLLDLGPKIEIEDPVKPTYALKTPVPIKFRVEASPAADGDNEAGVDKVSVLVSGVELEVEEDKSTPGLYQTSVNFNDRALFQVPPSASQITITATNKRSPAAAARNAKADFAIDGQGPSIVVREPADGSIVPGKRKLKFEVTDPSGVNTSSLVANFNQGLIVLRDNWTVEGAAFSQEFDASMRQTLTRLSVQITAADLVGNESTVTLVLKLDNLPPVISLTPPAIRETRKNGTRFECSALFDPVGDAPNDEDRITSYGYFRALVEDKTNTPPFGPGDPLPITYVAGLAAGSIEVHMQRDVSIPLLVDRNGPNGQKDGICDEINNKTPEGVDLPEGMRPRLITLAPVNPNGLAWYKLQDSASGDNPSCYTPTTMMSPVAQPAEPNPICLKTSMYRVLPGRVDGRPPAVYALNPTNQSTGACTGDYWELSEIASPGWICVAARAKDNVGNVGVSEPVRLCYGPDPCTGPVPSCTDGCTISDAQKFRYTEGNESWYFP